MKTKIQAGFLFLTIIQFLIISSCQRHSDNKKFEFHKKSLAENIGEEFKISDILDSSRNKIKIDFTKSDLTIIDFWFNDFPPCIEELNQFANLLPGKEKKISIISISINQPWLWYKTFKEHSGRFAFLNNKLSNWSHFVLQSSENGKLKNTISTDRSLELQKTYNVTFFPAYFVVDKKGIILTRPESAVDYIKEIN